MSKRQEYPSDFDERSYRKKDKITDIDQKGGPPLARRTPTPLSRSGPPVARTGLMTADVAYTNYARLLSRNKIAERKAKHELAEFGYPMSTRQVAFADGSSGIVPSGRRVSGYGAYSRRRVGIRRRAPIRRRRLHGRGSYASDAYGWVKKNLPKGSFARAGGWLGNALGGREGGIVGEIGGRALSRLAGFGAYDAQGPNERMTQEVPMIDNSGGDDGAICIRHKEFVSDIYSTGSAFNLGYTFSVNPGLSSTFPWLSSIAANFTQYKIKGLAFMFKSTSGNLSTSQALGEIIMSVNYNAADAAFVNKQQMLNEIFAISQVPSTDALIPLECSPGQTPIDKMYVRTGANGTTQDIRFYDIGTLYVATQGQNAAVTLGELWVTYEIELYKPQLLTLEAAGDPTAVYSFNSFTSSAQLTGHTVTFDNIGLTLTNTVITFPPNSVGNFLVVFSWRGASTSNVLGTLTASAGMAVVNDFGDSNNYISNANGTNTTFILVYMYYIANTGAYSGVSQTMTFGTGWTLPGTPVCGNLVVTNLNTNL